jgi:hypothetical protein
VSVLAEILAEEDAPPPVAAKERPAVEEVSTPVGIEIRYDDRKHYYWLRASATLAPLELGGTLESEQELVEAFGAVPMIDWVKVPSVSTILQVLDKPALPWWGMKIGVAGVLELVNKHGLRPEFSSVEEIVGVPGSPGLLTAHKLTVNHVRDEAGDRGTTVHDALEAWATDGTMPDPAAYADEQRGYVQGLVAFLSDAKITPTSAEVIVGSLEHRFAGRYDLEAIMEECELVTLLDEKKGIETRSIVPAGAYLPDLKTSGAVYPEMFLQLEGYEGARIECGYPATDARAVIRVTADGRYEFRVSPSRYEAFLAVKHCHDMLVELRAAAKS